MDFEGNLLRSDFFEVILPAGIFIAVILSLSRYYDDRENLLQIVDYSTVFAV